MKTYSINIKAFEVSEPDSGGINSNRLALFSEYSVAREYVEQLRMESISKNHEMFWPKNITEKTIKHEYTVYDSVAEMESCKKEHQRKLALAKLTKEERDILGLSEN